MLGLGIEVADWAEDSDGRLGHRGHKYVTARSVQTGAGRMAVLHKWAAGADRQQGFGFRGRSHEDEVEGVI